MRFHDRDIEGFWDNPAKAPRRVPPELRKVLYRKLQMLDAATSLDDLRIPPGNRLERLVGDRAGMYSIRVNNQWRICFSWNGHEAEGVGFDDYH
ncbi:MAG: type II toxin-antitoxin system RelE/ParE family toxin [Coriobacteriales bacterium]|nr:type II toxin-antitoxin system RelE/ParE family toxin [Coriobacteriales bacterium]